MGIAEVIVLVIAAPGMCLLLFVLARLESWLDAAEAVPALAEAVHPAAEPMPAPAEPAPAPEPVPAGTTVLAPEPGTLAMPAVTRTGPAGQAALNTRRSAVRAA